VDCGGVVAQLLARRAKMNVKNKFLYLAVLIVLIAVLLQGHRLPSAGQAFDSPLPTLPAPMPIETSPYQLVKMRKGEDMQGEFEFVLNVDGADVVRQTHLVP